MGSRFFRPLRLQVHPPASMPPSAEVQVGWSWDLPGFQLAPRLRSGTSWERGIVSLEGLPAGATCRITAHMTAFGGSGIKQETASYSVEVHLAVPPRCLKPGGCFEVRHGTLIVLQ